MREEVERKKIEKPRELKFVYGERVKK